MHGNSTSTTRPPAALVTARRSAPRAAAMALRLTLVLVSHDSLVVRRAQRIGVMSRGRLSIRQDTRA